MLYDPISDQCVSVCPDELPVNGLNGICESCPPTLPYWTGDGCAQRCQEAYDANNVCRLCRELNLATPVWGGASCRACQLLDGGIFWNAELTKCVAVCPDEAPKARPNMVCDICRDGVDAGHYWLNGDCAAWCPET